MSRGGADRDWVYPGGVDRGELDRDWGTDEPRREHATMFAFGVPVRRVIALSIQESLIIGILGTLIGIGVGFLLLNWRMRHMDLPATLRVME